MEYVGRLAPVPVLLLTGSEDAAAPPEDAERLFARCKEPRRLVLVPGADHYTMVATGGQFYRDTILDFLICTLRSASRAA